MKLLVLDGNSLVNRAYFGIKLLTTKDGRYTNAIFGFQNILLNLLSAHHPDAVAIAWDEKAPTFRHTAYDGYKATRHGMPQELAEQMPVLKQLLTDLGFVQVSKPGWEADDILGTLAAANEAAGGTTLLATGDRDSLQLVSDTTTVLLAATVMGRSKTVTMDVDAIQEKYGIQPRQLIEVKSLMGDASDNIPGGFAVTFLVQFFACPDLFCYLCAAKPGRLPPMRSDAPVTAPAVARPRADGRFAGVLWNNSTRM